MAGHSKWSKIKRQKAVADVVKGKIFTKIIREITIAAPEGGGEISTNARLSLAIDNAKANNMPKDNIERAIKKGVGDVDGGSSYTEVIYEGYGPGGVAYLVEASTDNINRTVGEIRHLFSKHGGNLGMSFSYLIIGARGAYHFLNNEKMDADQLILDAIDAGAEDVDVNEIIEITTSRGDLYSVRQQLENKGYTIQSAELQRIASTSVAVSEEDALLNFKLMDKLEDNDDVANVFSNMEMSEATLQIAENM